LPFPSVPLAAPAAVPAATDTSAAPHVAAAPAYTTVHEGVRGQPAGRAAPHEGGAPATAAAAATAATAVPDQNQNGRTSAALGTTPVQPVQPASSVSTAQADAPPQDPQLQPGQPGPSGQPGQAGQYGPADQAGQPGYYRDGGHRRDRRRGRDRHRDRGPGGTQDFVPGIDRANGAAVPAPPTGQALPSNGTVQGATVSYNGGFAPATQAPQQGRSFDSAYQQGYQKVGVLEIMDAGNGFLRQDKHWMPGPEDVYVSQQTIRRLGLRTGDLIVGYARPPKESEKHPSLVRIESVNEQDPETCRHRPWFDNLTAIFPNERFDLELKDTAGSKELQQANISNRVINLFAPIGKGQRGLLVSPPKAGKTMLLKGIAHGITRNYPDVYVMVALIGERPEEVTDWQKTVPGAEVISSTFDEPPESHTRVAEMCLERAKRLVEMGRDVVILLDSITRLARAYNYAVPSSGKTLSGGMDPAALFPPKRFCGAARNVEEGGSLTILSTCLVETESRLDDVIFEEFKGTANMEIRLDRKLQEKRIFPAINAGASSTRREELLLEDGTLRQVITLRRMLAALGNTEDALQAMVQRMSKTSSNAEFLATLKDMV
jgi:transcription termination factor Rho